MNFRYAGLHLTYAYSPLNLILYILGKGNKSHSVAQYKQTKATQCHGVAGL